jgi:hypothetical protein
VVAAHYTHLPLDDVVMLFNNIVAVLDVGNEAGKEREPGMKERILLSTQSLTLIGIHCPSCRILAMSFFLLDPL